MEKLECPTCGGEMTRAIQDLHYEYKGKSLTIPAMDAQVCGFCYEVLFASPEDGARYDVAIRAHIAAADAADKESQEKAGIGLEEAKVIASGKTLCPACGAAELIHDTRDMPYTYKGETTLITQ